MPQINTKRITVWRALLDGDCKQIHKTESQLWTELRKRNAWYEPEDEHRWSAVTDDEDVPVVSGVPHDWSDEGGCGGVHIHWQCPYCDEEHYTDDDLEDESPYLWFCENGRGLVLVEVDGT